MGAQDGWIKNWWNNKLKKLKSFKIFARGRKVLENRIAIDEERMVVCEKELETAILFGEDSDRKYEEVRGEGGERG